MGQFVYPLALCLVQPLFQPVHYNFVGGLSLFIALGISRCRIPVLYSQFTTVSLKDFVVQLEAIVLYESMRDTKSCDKIPPNKPLHVLISDVWKGFYFDPFGELINPNKEPSPISSCFWKWLDNIQSPLCKRPWTGNRVEDPSCLMNVRGIRNWAMHCFCLFILLL